MHRILRNRDGVGLVSAMLTLSLLALFAMVAGQLAVNERRGTLNELWYASAFQAADGGGESAIAWLTVQRGQTPITDFSTKSVKNEAETEMEFDDGQKFEFDIAYVTRRPRQGYEIGSFSDFVYDVDSEGRAGQEGASTIGVRVNKLTRTGYQAY